MELVVEASVSAIYVHVDGRIDHGVVQRRVEHCLLGIRSDSSPGFPGAWIVRDVDYAKFLLPFRIGLGSNLVERFSGSLGSKVFQRSGASSGR